MGVGISLLTSLVSFIVGGLMIYVHIRLNKKGKYVPILISGSTGFICGGLLALMSAVKTYLNINL